ncbi:uncharacterized protein BDZ99DRAFT_85432 [Mytilinidion resinicola]|uniref:Uncharacterized protein n=1 Tax=Mytilinidion resinicola TaxID=574789 RepID=A0A6A6YFJ6_9PEZI|nr:uncharacterized protein BDZ99DRAFT_85432 [Mytilinidion resinicola]KAF2806794.1 hypothetical protein BDZ99DRAFT_85432 [Mytilinidion resinicola]
MLRGFQDSQLLALVPPVRPAASPFTSSNTQQERFTALKHARSPSSPQVARSSIALVVDSVPAPAAAG